MKKDKKVQLLAAFVILSVLVILILFQQEDMLLAGKYSWVREDLNEEDEYRETQVSEGVLMYAIEEEVQGEELAELITYSFFYENSHKESLVNRDVIEGLEDDDCIDYIQDNCEDAYESMMASNQAIWADVQYFPVPESSSDEDMTVCFENSWKFERTFGGRRYHEGCDIMADENQRGVYPVISMCDGVVEKKGWLTKGGYRIGIRGNSGAYFYYAHLESYADIEEGDQVKAGQILGYMGDSGYGDEGTTGKFDVHLHVGIYIKTKNNEELSVNPYPVLKYLENRKLTMDFGLE